MDYPPELHSSILFSLYQTLPFYFVSMLYFVGIGDLSKVSHMWATHSASNTTPILVLAVIEMSLPILTGICYDYTASDDEMCLRQQEAHR